jgi:ABC-type Fe3+-siderophore transport system permease subunit
MELKKIGLQAFLAGLTFLIISLILERSVSADTLAEKGIMAAVFAVIYALVLWVRQRYKKGR